MRKKYEFCKSHQAFEVPDKVSYIQQISFVNAKPVVVVKGRRNINVKGISTIKKNRNVAEKMITLTKLLTPIFSQKAGGFSTSRRVGPNPT